MLAVPSYFLALLVSHHPFFFLELEHSQCQVIFMRLLHFLKLCTKKPKRCSLSRDGNPSPKLPTPSLCHFLSPEIGFCMRKVSTISLYCLRASLFFHLCRDLPVSHGKTGKAGWVCVQTRVLPSSPSRLCAPRLHSDSWGQYCFWQTLGSSWHRTCWKQELVITINPFLQSFVFKPFKLSCNLHKATSHTAGEPFAMNLLKSMFCSGSEFLLGLC